MQSMTANLDDALRHWQAAKSLVGEKQAAALFEQIVNVGDLLRTIDAQRYPAQSLALLEWVYQNVERKEDYKIQLVNLALELAVKALMSHSFSAFHSRLETAAKFDSDMKSIAQKIKKLGNPAISRIVQEMEKSEGGRIIKRQRSDMYGMILFRTVIGFASVDLPFALMPELIPAFVDKILIAVTADLRSN